MDSPESNKIVTSTSASPAVQDSPFFNYLSNLSPIKPVKVAHVARAFSELNFPPPPPVFTSPHINPQPETSFLKRSQYPLSSSGKLSLEHDDEGKIFTECSNVSGRPVTQSMIGLVPCTQKEFDRKRTVQIQSCSPSWLVDEYLVDPIDVESANSPGSGTNDVPQELQSDCTREKEPILKLDDCGDDERTKHMETEMAAPLTTLEQSEDDLLGKSHVCPEGMSDKVNDLVFYNLSPESASGAQDCQHLAVQDVKLQHADGGQLVEYDCNLQLLPESLQIVPAYVDPDKNSGAISNEPVEKMSFDLVEASQHHRGTRRRCLQFEAAEAHRNTIGNSSSVRNPKNIFPNSKLPANPTDLDSLDSSHLESSATYRSNEPVNISHNRISRLTLGPIETPKVCFDKAERSVRNIGNSLIAAPMPSGIGLHLNSIVNATAMGCIEAPSMESTEKDNSNLQREKSPSVTKHRFPEESKSNSSLARNISANHNDDQQESLAIVPESSATSHSPYENADTFEEFNQLSPKKKRKRTSYTMENEGCKRCNCKRSKCLKLYCECFAAGMYCAEPCACQDCFNKPEYEDTVLGTRQQIESRNPLAFAPKIVSRVTESPANSGEDGGRMTPSSARHKRGCNCKKSMCLKKYCECYQSGVGCSDGCRCEGCKNIFGIKEEHYGTTEMVHRRDDEESWENQSDGNLDVVDTRSNFSHPEQCHARNLSPPIPVVQCSRVEVLKSQLPASRYLPSLESNTNILSSYGKRPISLRNSDSHDRETKMGEGNKEIVSYDLDLECSVAQTGDQFLPGRDGLADICDLTPLPCPPSRVTPSSSSSNTKDSTKVSQVQLHRGSEQLSLVESLRWRSSPITPLPRLGGNKLPQDPSSNAGYEILEDDTPEILKDTCTPIKAVKVSSPNQKRVSPPHSYLHELRSNTSPGLRSGRKFVLKSISSFPPLTPHSDPKGSSSGGK